ncbi:hypothetical protein BA768_05890 [Chryseobacterium sp. CBo1]|uniref:T9SS type A sorting domain-containing protein n=1 Tax=Chryseobacterium sp. CBo1 TaxID=1869230 RepID=UPI0008106535|nr:T9SS type A sorting domain-containing protein [Chryseobacterium sp. CBo1]OCK50157.1 hypothetical protein BA768_05890 [Chryseobacterium sp. CBo1]
MVKISTLNFGKALIALGVFANVISANAQQWENVGSSANISAGTGSFNNLVIDTQGNYYVSYYDLSVTKASVQKFNGTSWSYVGGNAGITTGAATYSSLSINPAGNILYYTNQGSGLEVRKFEGSTWSSLPSASSATTNYQASAVSSSNILFTYGSYGSGTVKRFVNGAWEQVGTANIAGGVPYYAEMVTGTNGKVYVLHNSSGIKVYENSQTASATDAWTLVGGANVGSSFTEGANATTDIAIGSDNTLYVVYSSPSSNNRRLNVKKFDGANWIQVGNADFGISDNLYNVSIAITPSGKLYTVASGWAINSGKNTVYEYNSTTNTWVTVGGDFVSDDVATYNDLQYDAATNSLVLTYSQNGIKVKRFSLNSLSVDDVKKNDFSIYPNPTNGMINVKGNSTIKSLEITNTVGQLLNAKFNSQQINLSSFPKGVYFIKINSEDGQLIIKKVIKN